MEELFGYIDSILFSNEENGFVIAKVKEPKKREVTAVLGAMPGVHVGENVRCQGKWKNHPKFGPQFEVASFTSEAPTDLVGIQRYLESGMIKGIGPAYAERIVKKFGEETLDVIDGKPAKLLTVPGIGEKRVEIIVRCWQEQREIRNVMIFLRGNGVAPSFAQKIYKKYGDESIEKMRENPYRIAGEIRGIGFKSADQIAQNLGIARDAPQRIQSGIQYVLWELSGEGHVCYPKEALVEEAVKILEVEQPQILKELHALQDSDEVVEEDGLVWIKPLYLSEVGIAREMTRLKGAPCALRDVDVPKALGWVEEKLRIQLASQQKEGVAKAISEKMMILTGGPGTGKSTITNAILRILEKLTKKILLAAPTGRAAKRMSEITRRKAFTIHSILEMDFTKGGFKRNRENPLGCELLIIDEASMIDTHLMYSLLKAIPSRTRVIFVGDIDQLPSVGPGNVLRDMIASESLCVVRLNEIFRQARGSHIITNAHKINQGEFPYLGGDRDFRFYEGETPEDIQRILTGLFAKELAGFDKKADIQILCPMKRGVIGTENLNQVMQDLLNPSPQPLLRMGKRFHRGDKVMQIRNNYDRNVFNGDVGYISEIDVTEQMLCVDYYGRSVEYEFSDLDELVLAYAVSIHKYQGSECPCVIIPVHTSHFKLLHRNLLYTGITRGKKRVILVGTKKAIAIAVNTEEVRKRHSGLLRFMRSDRLAGHFAGEASLSLFPAPPQ
ncbi:MAG: ATP-dependent RecD-like DNA helicase [Simkaniaceae bacterium]|nr:ATP-dependent RecD-like DNA helicase [Candidatus Sacchlamyda saccharinae]